MFVFTDGEPFNDETYNIADTADWNGVNDDPPTSATDNGTAGDLDDILRAMFDMDFIPGNGFKNNITSYVIGFAIDTATLKSTDGVAGGTYTTANDTEELNEAISDAINAVSAELGSSGTVTFNSAKLESDTALYSVTFNSGGWIGDVESFSLSSTGEIDENSAWQAQSKLEAFDYADRNIITYNDNSKAGVPFALANLTSSSILADLQEGQNVIAGGTQGSDANVTQLINFISGDTSNEGTESNTFRDRTKLLADIVNSSPAFVGDSNDIWPDFGANNAFGTALKPYSAFRTATESREEVLYVGSNDGMLHGFKADLSATGGNELMAYIPNAISSTETGKGLHNLAAQGFVHRQYVDGAPAVRDAFIKTTAAGDKDWHTVLLSGLGAGGKGIFALDVTNPSVFSDPAANADNVVMWEFSADDDTNLGLTYAQPKIVKLNNGKWGAIFGNGYNNSGDGHAELFIVYIEEGLDGTWSYGTPSVPDDYIRLDTETGSAETPNGLSTATVVDTDNDYIVDRVYAGDLQGNMWVFDISSADAANWGSAFTSGSAPQPLFTAQSGQAITSSPSLTYNPSVDTEVGVNEPNILVLFGTGKYLHTTDISDTAVQSYYAVWDKGVGGLSSANLAPRGLVETAFEGVRRRASTGVDVDYTTQSGWFINLLNDASNLDTVAGSVPAGERVLSRSLLRGDTVFFPTQIPDDAVCAKGGESWLLAADIASGLAASQPSFDANGDNVINAADLGFIGVYQSGLIFGTNILGNREYFMKDDQTDSREINFGGSFREGRFSWFELIQD
jgi:type IV pilus assembly protein PilY1